MSLNQHIRFLVSRRRQSRKHRQLALLIHPALKIGVSVSTGWMAP